MKEEIEELTSEAKRVLLGWFEQPRLEATRKARWSWRVSYTPTALDFTSTRKRLRVVQRSGYTITYTWMYYSVVSRQESCHNTTITSTE